jgi:hypothetical protein
MRKIRLYPMPVLPRLKHMLGLVLTAHYTLDSASKAALVGYHLGAHTSYGKDMQLEDFAKSIDQTFTALAGHTNPYGREAGETDMAGAVKDLCELVLARSADAELLKMASALLSEIEDEENGEGEGVKPGAGHNAEKTAEQDALLDDSEVPEDSGETIADEFEDGMDGDHASALASAGLGTDEDYGGADAGTND